MSLSFRQLSEKVNAQRKETRQKQLVHNTRIQYHETLCSRLVQPKKKVSELRAPDSQTLRTCRVTFQPLRLSARRTVLAHFAVPEPLVLWQHLQPRHRGLPSHRRRLALEEPLAKAKVPPPEERHLASRCRVESIQIKF